MHQYIASEIIIRLSSHDHPPFQTVKRSVYNVLNGRVKVRVPFSSMKVNGKCLQS